MAYETCPHCANPLAPALSSGRQVCGRCGWVSQATKTAPQSDRSPRPLTSTAIEDQTTFRKLLSVLCHASLFLSLIGLALMILLWLLYPDAIVKKNAKEAINFHINLWLYAFGLFFIVLLAPKLAFALFCLLIIGAFVLPVMAMIHCFFSRDMPFTYPFILHIL